MLADLARQAMIDRGFEPDFPDGAERQLDGITAPAHESGLKDMRDMLWCSIDNDDSRDLDQLTIAEATTDGARVLVAVADVDAVVKRGTPIDAHAQHNTTSVYTAAKIFPMLPEKLSTNLTSLNEGEDRVAVVMDMQVASDGTITTGDVYRALVHNKAQLAYESVGMWLEGHADAPPKVTAIKGLAENLKLQDKIADAMRENRHEHGALDLETIEPRAVLRDGQVVDLKQEARNNARNLIEDFMIAANGVTARFLDAAGVPSIRRIVRSSGWRWPKRKMISKPSTRVTVAKRSPSPCRQ